MKALFVRNVNLESFNSHESNLSGGAPKAMVKGQGICTPASNPGLTIQMGKLTGNCLPGAKLLVFH